MSQEVILTLDSLVSGGGLSALLKVFLDARKGERDDHIATWRGISTKQESQIEALEQKLRAYESDFLSLEQYVNVLERIILTSTLAQHHGLPERPVMERGRNLTDANLY